MPNEIIEIIDQTYRENKGKNFNQLRDVLMLACPPRFRKVDMHPTTRWKKAVIGYMNELQKVEQWNKISREFN